MYESYEELDKIHEEFQEAIQYAQKNIESIIENATKNAVFLKYQAKAHKLGAFCPSLITDKIIINLKQGKLRHTPPAKSDFWSEFHFDKFENLLVVKQKFKGGSDGVFIYPVDYKGFRYYFEVRYYDDSPIVQNVDCERAKFDENGVILYEKYYCAGIFDWYTIWIEEYNYDRLNEGFFECNWHDYNPRFINSSFDNKIGDEGSPTRLHYLQLKTEKKEVIQIDCYSVINDKLEHVFKWPREKVKTGGIKTKEAKKRLSDLLLKHGFNKQNLDYAKAWLAVKEFSALKFDCIDDMFLWQTFSSKDFFDYNITRQFVKADGDIEQLSLSIFFEYNEAIAELNDELWSIEDMPEFFNQVEMRDSFKLPPLKSIAISYKISFSKTD